MGTKLVSTRQTALNVLDSDDLKDILPEQFYDHVRESPSWYGKMAYGLLEVAFKDLLGRGALSQKTRLTREIEARNNFLDAYAWFFNSEPNWVFSFETVCDFFDIDPDWVRARLKEVLAQPNRRPFDLPHSYSRGSRLTVQAT